MVYASDCISLLVPHGMDFGVASMELPFAPPIKESSSLISVVMEGYSWQNGGP